MKTSIYTLRTHKHEHLERLMQLKAGEYIVLTNTERPERPTAKRPSYSYACNLAYAANMRTSPATFAVRSVSDDKLRIVRLRDEGTATEVAPPPKLPPKRDAHKQTDATASLWAVSFGAGTPTLIFSDQDIANSVANGLGDVSTAIKVL